MKKKIAIGFILFLTCLVVIPVTNAGEKDPPGKPGTLFAAPVKLPIYLSSNFMELRPDHFHSGIDIKTRGTEGIRIYSIADGYVSRIKVSTSGFGKAVYITHPNGYTSVYAHLSRFSEKIIPLVRARQYKEQSYTVDLFLSKDDLPVSRDEVIGFSGNTGNSFGPHLHFEIRDAQTQHPVNPLQFGFPVRDSIPPVFRSISFYPGTPSTFIKNKPGRVSISVQHHNHQYKLTDPDPVFVTGPFSLGIEVQDYLDGSRNRCEVYDLQISVDGRKVFHIVMDEFSYSDTRYINAMMDYGQKLLHGRNIIRTYRTPNNRLKVYRTIENNGLIDFHVPGKHRINIAASDIYGNTSRMDFEVRFTQPPVSPVSLTMPEPENVMRWDQENRFAVNGCEVTIPKYALYDTINFSFDVLPKLRVSRTPVYKIHEVTTPLQKPFTLTIIPENIDNLPVDKLSIASVDSKNRLSYAGGEWMDGSVTAELRKFGNYTVTIDTVPPEVRPLQRISADQKWSRQTIAFRISDDFSGIDSYVGKIDGRWVLFEYEPKKNLIWTTLEKGTSTGKKHRLDLTVSDQKQNTTTYSAEFLW